MKIKLRSRARGAHKRLSCTAQQYKMFQNQSGTCHTLCFHFKLQTLDAHTHTKYEPSKEEEEYSLPFDLAAAWCECMKERTIFLMMIRHDNVCCFDDSSSGMSVLRVVCVCVMFEMYIYFFRFLNAGVHFHWLLISRNVPNIRNIYFHQPRERLTLSLNGRMSERLVGV